MLSSITQDVRYALRGMRQRSAFTAIVLVTLTLGIGANAAIFSVVEGVLLRPLPYAQADRIAQVSHDDPYWTVSEPEFADYKRDLRSFERLAAYNIGEGNLTGIDVPERIQAASVSDGFFAILGVPAQVGRTFTPDEDSPKAARVAVLSEGLWRRRFGADPSIIGREIRFDGEPRTIVGVMPSGFAYPQPDVAVWVPLRLNFDSLWTRNNHYLRLIGKLASGATVERARSEQATLIARFAHDYPDIYFPDKRMRGAIVPLEEGLLGKTRPYLLALLGAVGFVLLIACVNVANLLLARGEARRREIAIRTSLGASTSRLIRQTLTESVTYAAIGGALGLALAWALTHALVAAAPESIPRVQDVGIDGAVLAFTVLISLATGLLFGVVPALRGAKGDVQETLKDGGRSAAPGRSFARMRGALVVAEVALAVVMLSGAGLLVRSLIALQAVELGIRPDHVLTMQVSLSEQEYPYERGVAFYEDLTTRIRALPGVRDAAAVHDLPISGGFSMWSILIDGSGPRSVADAPGATPQHVTPGYFATMGIPLVRGRVFTERDREGAPYVAVVNEAMARQLWPGTDAIGHTLKMLNPKSPWVTVVGVVKDVRSSGFDRDVPPTMYFTHAQGRQAAYTSPRAMSLVVRTTGDPLAMATAVRGLVHTLDANVPVTRIMSMEQVVASSVASRRFTTLLLSAFAALALLLAGIGIYGVIAYAVSQRTFEIGLRVALGASHASVVGLMLNEGLRLAATGLAVGLLGALAVTRLLASLLVGVRATDALTYAVVAGALGAVALLASWIPARRAARVQPVEAMRGA